MTAKKEEKKPVGRPRKYKPGQHPNSLEAIKKNAFKRGDKRINRDGSNVGKKPKPSFDELLNQVGHEWLTRTIDGKEVKLTKYEAFCSRLWKDAIAGKSPAVKELAERLFGKSPEFLNVNVKSRPKFKAGDSPENYIEKIMSGEVKIKA